MSEDKWTGKTAKQRWKVITHELTEASDGYNIGWMRFTHSLLSDGFPMSVVERIELLDNRPFDAGAQVLIPRKWKNAVMALLEERE